MLLLFLTLGAGGIPPVPTPGGSGGSGNGWKFSPSRGRGTMGPLPPIRRDNEDEEDAIVTALLL